MAKKRAYKFPSSIGGCFQYLRPQTAILFDGPTLFMANFRSFFSMGFKICTLRCYTVLCAKRYDRYEEKPFNRTEKKNIVRFHDRVVKKAFFSGPLGPQQHPFIESWTALCTGQK